MAPVRRVATFRPASDNQRWWGAFATIRQTQIHAPDLSFRRRRYRLGSRVVTSLWWTPKWAVWPHPGIVQPISISQKNRSPINIGVRIDPTPEPDRITLQIPPDGRIVIPVVVVREIGLLVPIPSESPFSADQRALAPRAGRVASQMPGRISAAPPTWKLRTGSPNTAQARPAEYSGPR